MKQVEEVILTGSKLIRMSYCTDFKKTASWLYSWPAGRKHFDSAGRLRGGGWRPAGWAVSDQCSPGKKWRKKMMKMWGEKGWDKEQG